MGVLDFLFQGKPPPSVTTYGNSTEAIPKWLSDYTQGIVSRANAVAGEGYQTYGAPRIADFNQDQNESMDLTRSHVGSYQPGMDLAKSFEEQAGGTSTLGAAQPYLTLASQKFPDQYQDYMNPYTDSVIDKAKLDATNYYQDTFAPALSKQFTAAGQYGSSQHEKEAMQEANKLTQGIQATSLAARSDAYNSAGTLFNNDANRQGALAQTAGQLAGADANIKGQAGRDLGSLTSANTALQRGDESALSAIGGQQQGMDQANLDLAYKDFGDQRDYDRNQLDWLNGIVKGLPHDTSTATTATGPLGDKYQPSTASSVLSGLAAIKGLFGGGGDGSDDSDSGWGALGRLFGGGGGGSPLGWADGGPVNVKPLTEMMARLEAKRRRPVMIDNSTGYVDARPQYSSPGASYGR